MRLTKEMYIRQIAQQTDRILPLMDTSPDEKLDVLMESENDQKVLRVHEHDDMEGDMFDKDGLLFDRLTDGQGTMTDDQYVNMCIQRAKKLFRIDGYSKEAKKINLGDVKATKID